MTSNLEKATWEDIKRNADQPPADNSDLQESGQASENYEPPHVASDYPESTSNTNGFKTGDDGYLPNNKKEMSGLGKAQSRIQKALRDPSIIKALETLEPVMKDFDLVASGEMKSEEEKDADAPTQIVKSGPSPYEVSQLVKSMLKEALGPINDSINGLQKSIAKVAGGSDLQKVGFVLESETGKPQMGSGEKVPAYAKTASQIQKAEAGEDEGVPSFDALAARPLGDITRGI